MKGNVEPISQKLNREQKRGLLTILRDARAILQSDSESFDQAASMLEHIGQVLVSGVETGLGGYERKISELAKESPSADVDRIEQLLLTVRLARNDAVHGGSYIRHHANHLVHLLLTLEEVLMLEMREVRDVMVQNPITAELWHNLAAVRRTMLANAFSYLPVTIAAGEWKIVSVFALVKYMAPATTAKEKKDKLGKTLMEAWSTNETLLESVDEILHTTNVAQVCKAVRDKPILVIEEFKLNKDGQDPLVEKRLVGILTAFDLL